MVKNIFNKQKSKSFDKYVLTILGVPKLYDKPRPECDTVRNNPEKYIFKKI